MLTFRFRASTVCLVTVTLCVYSHQRIYRLHFGTNTFLQFPCIVERAFRDLFMHQSFHIKTRRGHASTAPFKKTLESKMHIAGSDKFQASVEYDLLVQLYQHLLIFGAPGTADTFQDAKCQPNLTKGRYLFDNFFDNVCMSSQLTPESCHSLPVKRGLPRLASQFRPFFVQVASAHPAGVSALRGLPPSHESLQPRCRQWTTCAKVDSKPFLVSLPTHYLRLSSITPSSLVSHPIGPKLVSGGWFGNLDSLVQTVNGIPCLQKSSYSPHFFTAPFSCGKLHKPNQHHALTVYIQTHCVLGRFTLWVEEIIPAKYPEMT